jgi:hypothetical protein
MDFRTTPSYPDDHYPIPNVIVGGGNGKMK